MPAIDAGAQDISRDEDLWEVLTEPGELGAVRAALGEAGLEVQSAEVAQLPKTRVELDGEPAARLLRLVDALEENDDVNAVHANFDVDAAILEAHALA